MSRNARLAAFWLNPQDAAGTGPFAGRSAIVVDVEDRFTTMLAHQLRHLGLAVEIVPWSVVTDEQLDEAELVVCGPGPGDPRDPDSARIGRMREIVTRRRASGRPLLAVCLSHQILADSLGIDLGPLARPHQGLQKIGRRVRDAGIHRLLQHLHGAGRTGHDRGRRDRDRRRPGRAMSTRCAAPDSPRSRATSSRSCRATG